MPRVLPLLLLLGLPLSACSAPASPRSPATPGGGAPLGVSEPLPVDCPEGVVEGALCSAVRVACGDAPTIQATLVVSARGGEGPSERGPAGTVVYFGGGPGSTVSLAEQAIVPPLVDRGLTVIQVVWGSPWEEVPARSVRAASCRPATLLRWLHARAQEAEGLSSARGFCAQGYSAGSSAIAHALAFHGAASVLDYAQLLSGPPMAAMDRGCRLPAATIDVCGATFSEGYEPFARRFIEGWEGVSSCGAGSGPSAEDAARLAADSALGPGATLRFDTRVGFASCAQPSAAAAQGRRFELAIEAAGTRTHRLCVSGSCSFENVLTDVRGRADVVSDLVRECHSDRGSGAPRGTGAQGPMARPTES